MWKALKTTALSLMLLVGFAGTSFAATNCLPHQAALNALARNHQEYVKSSGVDAKGNKVEVLTNADGTTWSILVINSKDVACIVSSGVGWRHEKPRSTDPEA